MNKIKVLVLDDMQTDFEKIQESVKQISETFKSQQIELELFYSNYSDAIKLVANYVAYKKESSNLQDVFKKVVDDEVKNYPQELISIIDIKWDVKSQYGCDFYCDYHNIFNDKNTVFITIVKKANLPEKIKGIETITKSKSEPFGDEFTKKLQEKLSSMPIIKNKSKQQPKTPPANE